MKIEKLNDNQIRCTLNRHDLIDRELKLSELAYGTEKARGLFRDVMNQAFDQFGFEAEDIPLIIEAIPVSGDCIILIVTKVEDPEELDTRFAKFSPFTEDDSEDDDDDELPEETGFAEDELASAQDIMDLIKKISEGIVNEDSTLSNHLVPVSKRAKEAVDKAARDARKKQAQTIRVFSFSSLNEVSALAAVISSSFTGYSTLYKNPRTKTYYLALENQGEPSETFTQTMNTASEYGHREKCTYATLAYYDEHYEVIVKDKAVEIMAAL